MGRAMRPGWAGLGIAAALLGFAVVGIACVPASDNAGATVPTPTSPSAVTRSVTGGAGTDEKASNTIKVAAASDLRPAMTQHGAEIERACQTKVTWVFGSSGQLATQIVAGADFGLLLSADVQYPADLDRRGLLVPGGLASYGLGRIVILTRPGLEPVAELRGLMRPDIRRIAIANPDHAPYGRAAMQAIESAGLSALRDRLVLGENIRQATDYVEQGNADAGIVALALVVNGSSGRWTLIDAAMHRSIEQAGGVVRNTGAELTGRCILQFLLDPPGQAMLARYGFEPVRTP